MLVVVTLYVSNNKKNEYQWDTVKTAFNRTEIKVESTLWPILMKQTVRLPKKYSKHVMPTKS